MVVNSPNVKYTEDYIFSKYHYRGNPQIVVNKETNTATVEPREIQYEFRTERKVPKTGLMIVGWGGNNGSTVTAGIIANRLGIKWQKKSQSCASNYFGSVVMASTFRLGSNEEGDVFVPFHNVLPMVHPNDFVLGGWDISSMNLAEAMTRADVLDYDLQCQLRPHMEKLKPLASCFDPDFIAANQSERADNIIKGSKQQALDRIRKDIRDFKSQNKLDKVIVLWSANTERFADVLPNVNDSASTLLKSIANDHTEVSPSTIFAVACILEGVPFINGSPQNTFVPGVLELAQQHNVHVSGDDFKSGQTKIKSVLVDFLVGAGIKPLAISSYNHLGNNDGKNLSAPKQFRSKEISKSNVVDDMVASNQLLYGPGEHPDHTVVIKYVPTVGDSKRAMDEYVSEIFMGGINTISIHNVCEDSLLASPLIIDLAILAELTTRISWKTSGMKDYESFHSVLSILSYLMKAPLVPEGTPVVNALFKQRACMENIFKACIGMAPEDHMLLEHKALPKTKKN